MMKSKIIVMMTLESQLGATLQGASKKTINANPTRLHTKAMKLPPPITIALECSFNSKPLSCFQTTIEPFLFNQSQTHSDIVT